MENIIHHNNAAMAVDTNAIQPVVEPKEQVARVRVPNSVQNGIRQEPRVSLGQWIKWHWLDILTMAAMGALGLGIYFLRPAPSRSFPIYNLNGDIAYPDNAYPLRREIVPIWAAALIASLVPMSAFLFMQLRIRSFWDLNNAVLGLLYALLTAAVFQVFVKWLIGGLRPHFLEVCRPDTSTAKGNGFGGIMYDRKICTNPNEREVNDALESFPSGHATAAFAGLVFLYLYLNAKFKVFSDYRPAYFKLVLLYMPILGAVLIGGALTIDEFHHWWDILAGALIGTMMALSAYRTVYASIWNHRYNHIPLYPDAPLAPFTEDLASRSQIWTRKAEWAAGASVPPSAGATSSANVLQTV